MPWEPRKNAGKCGSGEFSDRPWAVVKKTDGSVVACHASQDDAQKQVNALYASYDKSIDGFLGVVIIATKGTANVSPEDRVKLRGILAHYAKEPHPFAACVRDNRKRFGPGAEAVCATIKDLIEGNTWWRQGQQRGEPAGYSPKKSLDLLPDLSPEFLDWLSSITLEEAQEYARLSQGIEPEN